MQHKTRSITSRHTLNITFVNSFLNKFAYRPRYIIFEISAPNIKYQLWQIKSMNLKWWHSQSSTVLSSISTSSISKHILQNQLMRVCLLTDWHRSNWDETEIEVYLITFLGIHKDRGLTWQTRIEKSKTVYPASILETSLFFIS